MHFLRLYWSSTGAVSSLLIFDSALDRQALRSEGRHCCHFIYQLLNLRYLNITKINGFQVDILLHRLQYHPHHSFIKTQIRYIDMLQHRLLRLNHLTNIFNQFKRELHLKIGPLSFVYNASFFTVLHKLKG
jgi:hypothetical protein